MKPLTIRPLHGVSPGEHEGSWTAVDTDPAFELLPPTAGPKKPWSAGWHRLDLWGDSDSLKKMASAKIYADEGAGFHETRSSRLEWFEWDGDRASAWFKLNGEATRLRLDPMEFVCNFTLRQVHAGAVSRYGVMLGMLQVVLRKRGYGFLPGLASDMLRTCMHGGPSAAANQIHLAFKAATAVHLSDYGLWLSLYDDWRTARKPQADAVGFSVLLPTYNTPVALLRECIDSVIAQTHPRWELCIVDDASTDAAVVTCIREYSAADSRIRLHCRDRNGHIANATNDALAMATMDYSVLMDHDDLLHPDALATLAAAITENPQARLLYSDEDKIDLSGQRRDPYFKSDLNLTLLHGHNCICHAGCYRTDLLRELGGFDPELSGAQDWDIALRVVRRLDGRQVVHVPRVLYHWRMLPGSTALAPGEKSYAHRAAKRALEKDLAAHAPAGTTVEELPGYMGCFRIRYPVPHPEPKVSIAIPTRDQAAYLERAVDGVLRRTDYDAIDLTIIDNGSVERETRLLMDRLRLDLRVRIIRHDQPFNFSVLNNLAFGQADGQAFLLLNNDVEVIHAGWLREMAGRLFQDDVGVVGCMLYYPDNTIQHAGVVTGFGGTAAHVYPGIRRGTTGMNHRAGLAQEMGAVTGACLLTRADIYRRLGGLDEAFAVAFNDIDYCLRVRQAGYKVVWTPFAELYHHESKSRGYDVEGEKLARFNREAELLRQRWGGFLECDPYYSPNFSLQGLPYDLAFPPRHPKT